jgi:hypothetical protein
LDRGTVTVQPAGAAGKRHVFLTIAFETEATSHQVEFVFRGIYLTQGATIYCVRHPRRV